MNAKEAPIIPVKQALITLAGYQFLVVQLPGGQIAIVFSYLCRALHVDRRSQTRRIQEHPLLAEYLLTVQIKTAKGERMVNALVVWALSGWLSGFQLTRLAKEQRAVILTLQREAFDTFVRPFFSPETKAQQHSAQPKPEPGAAPLPPPQAPPLSGLDHLHLGIDGIGRKDAEQDARLDSLEQNQAKQGARLDRAERHLGQQYDEMTIIFEDVDRLKAQVTNLASTGPLAFAHQVELQTRLKALEHHSGQPRGALERELADTFGVQVIEQVPEVDWGRIVGWFQARLGW